MLVDTLLWLTDLILIEPNPPEMEGQECGYSRIEQLQDINVHSNKGTPVSSVTFTNIEINDENNAIVTMIKTLKLTHHSVKGD